MDYSLRTLFVVPVGNTLPVSGSTENLTAGQVGFFDQDYAVTDGTGSPDYIYVAQGRANTYLMGSKRSDKIEKSKVKFWYKVDGQPTAANEIWDVSDFTGKCGEDITLTVRIHSSYADTISFNGITRSITVKTACCDCGEDPCTTVDAEAIVDSILEKVALEQALPNDPAALKISTFLDFAKVGTGASTKLRITGKALTKYGNPCDVAAFPWEYDRLWFRVFIYKGPETTSDFIVADKCDPAGVTTVVQRSSFPTGTSDEVIWLEKDYWSYQNAPQKHLFRMVGYNQTFESYVTDGTTYDFYYIQFDQHDDELSWSPNLKLDEAVIICAPQGTPSTNVATVLTNFLGTPKDKTCATNTTTSTTSTTSTTTSTTTTLIP